MMKNKVQYDRNRLKCFGHNFDADHEEDTQKKWALTCNTFSFLDRK